LSYLTMLKFIMKVETPTFPNVANLLFAQFYRYVSDLFFAKKEGKNVPGILHDFLTTIYNLPTHIDTKAMIDEEEVSNVKDVVNIVMLTYATSAIEPVGEKAYEPQPNVELISATKSKQYLLDPNIHISPYEYTCKAILDTTLLTGTTQKFMCDLLELWHPKIGKLIEF